MTAEIIPFPRSGELAKGAHTVSPPGEDRVYNLLMLLAQEMGLRPRPFVIPVKLGERKPPIKRPKPEELK